MGAMILRSLLEIQQKLEAANYTYYEGFIAQGDVGIYMVSPNNELVRIAPPNDGYISDAQLEVSVVKILTENDL